MSDDPDDSDDEDPFEAFESVDAPEDADPFEDLQRPDDGDNSEERPTDSDVSPERDESPSSPDTDASAAPGRMTDDPFDRQDSTQSQDTSVGSTDDQSQTPEASPADTASSESGDGTDVWNDETEPADDPLTSLTGGASTSGDDPFEAFESAGVEEIDPDGVWESLAAAEEDEMPDFEGKTFYEVSKHRFCERCEFFSEPPDTECTYEGAAIVEFLDMETVRLLNCPVVAEQRALEEGGTEIGSQ